MDETTLKTAIRAIVSRTTSVKISATAIDFLFHFVVNLCEDSSACKQLNRYIKLHAKSRKHVFIEDACIEYILLEVIELASHFTTDNKKKIIQPFAIWYVIKNDQDLLQAFTTSGFDSFRFTPNDFDTESSKIFLKRYLHIMLENGDMYRRGITLSELHNMMNDIQ